MNAVGRSEALVQRAGVVAVVVLGLATWFAAAAVVPSLREEWGIDDPSAVWLTASTQLGFVAGAIASALTQLADRVPSHLLLGLSAAGASLTSFLFAFAATGLDLAIPLRALTGVFLAGVYPIGMKLMASWAPSFQRGKTLGVLIGALTLGSALPHLVGGFALEWRAIVGVTAALTGAASIVSLALVRSGPHGAPRISGLSIGCIPELFRERGARLINLGYLGHMWELYALWTWFPVFALSTVAGGAAQPGERSLAVFLTIGAGGVLGCLIGGWAADRFGRPRTVIIALTTSGACCLLSPFVLSAPVPALTLFAAVWGASVIADSGVFSTMLSERVDPRHVGTALTLQTAMGFLVTVVSIQIVPGVAHLIGWQWALTVLALGPAAGVVAMLRFSRRARPTASGVQHLEEQR